MATYGSLRQASARFGPFQVDLNSNELFRSGERVPIQDQPLQVLRLLLEAEGNVVKREQLRAALWPQDTFVDFEHGVNTAVKKLRQALEDSAEQPKFVETLPRIGYRFITPVEWVGDGRGPRGARRGHWTTRTDTRSRFRSRQPGSSTVAAMGFCRRSVGTAAINGNWGLLSGTSAREAPR